MNARLRMLAVTVTFGLWFAQTPAFAEETDPVLRDREDERGTYSFVLENDKFAGKDDGYTNGVRISWLSPETDIPDWIDEGADYVPFFSHQGRRRYGFSLGQTMYAPDDLTVKQLQDDDRPYAGFLFGSVGILSDTGYRLDNLQLTLGVVGPASLAAETQDFVHHSLDTTDPQGWDNQLHNEPGFILTYERKWRGIYEFSPFGLAMDMTPHLGASLGNIHTHITTGATARIGFDLPADYGPPLIQPSLPGSDFFAPSRKLGGYLFAGVEGRAVLHNIFLDGNTFRDSHSVDKKPFVGGIQVGVALTYGDARLAYTHLFRTKEFDGQDSADEFGAITLSYRF